MPTSPKTPSQNRKSQLLSLIGLAIALAVSIGIFVFREQIAQFRTHGYTGVFVLSLIGHATILLPLPTFMTAFVGGGVFNPIVVALLAGSGAAVGELTGYLVGLGGQDVVRDQRTFTRVRKWTQRYGALGIFLMAVFPNPFFDMAGLAAGLLRLPVSKFLVATFLGRSFLFLIFSFLGAGSSELIQRFL